jgi:hypothetical protein
LFPIRKRENILREEMGYKKNMYARLIAASIDIHLR